LIKAIKRD